MIHQRQTETDERKEGRKRQLLRQEARNRKERRNGRPVADEANECTRGMSKTTR